jgi:hypothetical protein
MEDGMTITTNKGQVNETTYEIDVITNGTEKQIDFANSIKIDKIGSIISWLEPISTTDARKAEFAKYLALCNAQNDAKFWIENECSTNKEIIKSLIAK